MEHFELYEKYRASLPNLRASLSHIGLGDRGLDSLNSILNNHFIEFFEQCNTEGQQKDYRNRQPKPQQSQLRPKRGALRERLEAAQRDSAVDVGMDEEGTDQSVLAKLNGPEYSRSSLDSEAADMLAVQLPTPGPALQYPVMPHFPDMTPNIMSNYSFQQSMPTQNRGTITASCEDVYGGYIPPPTGATSLPTRSPSAAAGPIFPDENFRYHGARENADQPQWRLGPVDLGFEEPMADLGSWVYQQHQRHQ